MGACACAWIVDYNLSRLQSTKVKVEMVGRRQQRHEMEPKLHVAQCWNPAL